MSEEFETYIANAIHWAQKHPGATTYAGRCLAFVEDAYEERNHVEIFGGSSAQESADEYGATQNTGEPPIGAFVFWVALVPSEMKSRIGDTLGCVLALEKSSTPWIPCEWIIIATCNTSHLRRVGPCHNSSAGRRWSASSPAIAGRISQRGF